MINACRRAADNAATVNAYHDHEDDVNVDCDGCYDDYESRPLIESLIHGLI